MKYVIPVSTLVVALALCIDPAPAAEKHPDATGKTKATQQAKPDAKSARKPVDVNNAGKAQLKKLPGIGESEAEKIVAGRPYGSKSHLVTRGIISREIYEGLKGQIIVKPK